MKPCSPVYVAFAAALLGVAPATSAAPHRVVDMARMSDPDGTRYSVSLCARESPGALGVPGHAFVAFSTLTRDGERSYVAVGHTTRAGAAAALLSYKGWIGSAHGQIAEEQYTAVTENCLVINTDREGYDRAWALANARFTLPGSSQGTTLHMAYTLGERDCIDFMVLIAEVFVPRGLVLPTRAETDVPLAYARRIIDAN